MPDFDLSDDVRGGLNAEADAEGVRGLFDERCPQTADAMRGLVQNGPGYLMMRRERFVEILDGLARDGEIALTDEASRALDEALEPESGAPAP